jgi:glycosyltransferase involved in cell wall biosynthesis
MSKNILVISEDLEQKYHRGIAFYAKSLLKATHSLGYHNYLMTSAPSGQSMALKELLVIKNLISPDDTYFGRKKIAKYYIEKYIGKGHLKFEDIPLLRFNEQGKQEARLDYIQHLKGFVNSPSQYHSFEFHPKYFKNAVKIDLPLVRKYDMVITTSPVPIIVKGTPLIQTLHDTIPVSTHFHPSTPSGLELIYKRLHNMLNYSDCLLSVSEYSRQELLNLFPGYEHKIKTTHIAVPISNEEYELAQNEQIARAVLISNNLEKNGFLFYVGAIEDRKNIERMVLAFNAIKDKIKIPLVIAGEIGSLNIHLKKLIQENKDIVFLGKIDNMTKLILFRSARAFLFPSLYEGFGIPPLEAMRMGCPVLTSNVTSLPEVCGDAALYVDPYSLDEMIDKMLLIASDKSVQDKLRLKGLEHVKQFSNEVYCERLKTVLEGV